ncbi:MAG: hypothetical protein LBS54_01735, partial [Dysgonamonadaceae bacterium]|nr:hypothetical protein [Dysgonamonadaceae bacterium]
MKKLFLLLALLPLFAASCVDKIDPEQVISDLTFTECNQDIPNNDATNANVEVEFTNTGLHITHHNLAVACDFDTVLLTHQLNNGVLTITEKGYPSATDCLCYTDVSYTIRNILQINMDTIIINGEIVWTNSLPLLTDEFYAFSPPMGDFQQGQVYIANTQEELLSHPYFTMNSSISDIPNTTDFETQSVLITYGTNTSGICNIKSTFNAITNTSYLWNILVYSNIASEAPSYLIVKVVPKISSTAQVNFTTT